MTGKVTRNSQAVPRADVIFTLQAAEDGQSFFGDTGDDGTYRLDLTGTEGVPPGSYDVTVTVWTLKDGGPLPEGEEGEVLKSDGKAVQFTTTFVKQVVAGDNQIDLNLDEGQPPGGEP